MKATVFFEGGGPPSSIPNPEGIFAGLTEDALLVQNALYRLFEKEIPNLKVLFNIYPSGGYKQTFPAFVQFVAKFSEVPAYVVLDFQDLRDLGGRNRGEHKVRLFKLAEDKIVIQQLPKPLKQWNEYENDIFFMVQKMESWIISQIEIVYNEY